MKRNHLFKKLTEACYFRKTASSVEKMDRTYEVRCPSFWRIHGLLYFTLLLRVYSWFICQLKYTAKQYLENIGPIFIIHRVRCDRSLDLTIHCRYMSPSLSSVCQIFLTKWPCDWCVHSKDSQMDVCRSTDSHSGYLV